MTTSRLLTVVILCLLAVNSSYSQEKDIDQLYSEIFQGHLFQEDPENFKFDFERTDSLGSFENYQPPNSQLGERHQCTDNKESKFVPSVKRKTQNKEALQKMSGELLRPAGKLKTISLSRHLETEFEIENVDPEGRNKIDSKVNDSEVSDLESDLEEENVLRTVSFKELKKNSWMRKRSHSITQYNQADTACAKMNVNDIGTELLKLIQLEDQVAPIRGTNFQQIIRQLEKDWLEWKFTYDLKSKSKSYAKVFFNNGLAFYTSGIHRNWTIFKRQKNVWKLYIENAHISFKHWRAKDKKPPTFINVKYSNEKIKIAPHNPEQFIPQLKRFKQVTQLSQIELKKFNRAAYSEYFINENNESEEIFFGYYHFQHVDYENISTKYRVTWNDIDKNSLVYEDDLIEIEPEIGNEVTIWIEELGPEAEYIGEIKGIRERYWFDRSAPGILVLRNKKQYVIEWEDTVREEIENYLIDEGGGFLKSYFEESEIIAIRNTEGATKRKRDE